MDKTHKASDPQERRCRDLTEGKVATVFLLSLGFGQIMKHGAAGAGLS